MATTHWTNTAKGKAHMNKMRKLAVKALKAKAKGAPPHGEDTQDSLNAAFVLGKVDAVIEQYCAWVGVPKAALAKRVAELLLNA